MNDRLIEAYNLAFKADFSACYAICEESIVNEPDNAAAQYVLGLATFMETAFLEDPELDAFLIESHNDLIDRVAKEPDGPFKHFVLAELNLQKGMMNLRLGNYISGMWDMRTSYNKLERNLQKHPNFLLSKKTYFSLQAMLSNIPDGYRNLIELFGYHTDQFEALNELNELQLSLASSEKYSFLRREVNLYRALLMHKLTERYDEAYRIIRNHTEDYKENPISCFIRGKMALDSKKTGEAVEVLSHFAGKDCPFPYINYDIARAYFVSLNEKCLIYFRHFIQQNKGDGLVKDTYLHMAWWCYMNGEDQMMKTWLRLLDEAPKSQREKDKVAEEEGKLITQYHPELLKARVTFDGGYYEYTLEHLKPLEADICVDRFNRIRFNYRMARIYQDMKQYDLAISWFKKVLKEKMVKGEYFIPVSNYQLALIYENQQKDQALAQEYYQNCLDYHSYPYEGFYQYKCELALKRLKG